MIIQDLQHAQNVILQLVWGDQMTEFPTKIFDRNDNGVYATPYVHNGQPLVMDITPHSGVTCNVFGDNPENSNRISFRNIELHTVQKNQETAYYLKTSSYNELANVEDRRNEERVIITKPGKVWDEDKKDFTEIRIHDVSNKGISFYAPTSFSPKSNILEISFIDHVHDHEFAFQLNCKTVRIKNQAGNVLYGCRLVDDNKDYLLYGCLRRMKKNAKVEAF